MNESTKPTYTLHLLTWQGDSVTYAENVTTEAQAEELAAQKLADDRRYAAVKIMVAHLHCAARTAMWKE